jgi:hypothetical protein
VHARPHTHNQVIRPDSWKEEQGPLSCPIALRDSGTCSPGPVSGLTSEVFLNRIAFPRRNAVASQAFLALLDAILTRSPLRGQRRIIL